MTTTSSASPETTPFPTRRELIDRYLSFGESSMPILAAVIHPLAEPTECPPHIRARIAHDLEHENVLRLPRIYRDKLAMMGPPEDNDYGFYEHMRRMAALEASLYDTIEEDITEEVVKDYGIRWDWPDAIPSVTYFRCLRDACQRHFQAAELYLHEYNRKFFFH